MELYFFDDDRPKRPRKRNERLLVFFTRRVDCAALLNELKKCDNPGRQGNDVRLS